MQLDTDTTTKAGGGTIKNCGNYGEVKTYITTQTGGAHVGGIAGYNKAGGIVETSTNYAQAIIYGISNVGGIVGNNAGTLRNCDNYSNNITAKNTTYLGKIFGRNSGTQTGNTNHA